MTRALSSEEPRTALRAVRKREIGVISALTEAVRGRELSQRTRAKAVALITAQIHSRDVVERLLGEHVQTLDDFAWVSQVRARGTSVSCGNCVITA